MELLTFHGSSAKSYWHWLCIMFSFTVLLSTCQFSALWNFNKIVNNAVSISQLAVCLKSQPAARRVLILIWFSQNGQKESSYEIIAAVNRCRKTIIDPDWQFYLSSISVYFGVFFCNRSKYKYHCHSFYISWGINFFKSLNFFLNFYICILILSSVTVKEEGDITELGKGIHGDTWWREWGRWLLSALSFNSFLNPNRAFVQFHHFNLSFLRECCITLQPAGNLWGASLPYPGSM